MPPDDVWLPLALVPVVAIAAGRARAVAWDGAIAGVVVGLALVLGLGWAGFSMLMALVVLGTLVSARGRRARDAVQVLCNGAVAAAFGLWGGGGPAAAALAASLSDTASGEIGRRFGRTPRRLLFGPPVPRGADGGMSWLGTLAGLVFAWPVPLLGWAFGALPGFSAASAAAAAGMTGNLVDSIAGASIQARLGKRANDVVNLLATAVAALIAVL